MKEWQERDCEWTEKGTGNRLKKGKKPPPVASAPWQLRVSAAARFSFEVTAVALITLLVSKVAY